MPIPRVAALESTLVSCSLKPVQSEGYQSLVVVPSTAGRDEFGKIIDSPEIQLWVSANREASVKSAIDRIGQELEAHGHVHDQTSALMIISLATLHPLYRADPISCLNNLIRSSARADLLQFFILPASAPRDFEVTVGSFRLGNLDVSKLNYWSQRAKSDFHVRYQYLFEFPRMTIQRSLRQISVIPFNLSGELGLRGDINAPAYQSLIVAYFDYIARHHWRAFWHAFVEEQSPLVAFGAPFIPDTPLRTLPSTTMVSVFVRIAGKPTGWVCPTNISFVALDFVSTDKRLVAAREELKTVYKFKSFSECESHQALRQFMLFLARAQRHASEGRISESFLHFIIALDLMFGGTEEIGRTVAKRVAAITYRALKADYEQIRKRVSDLYRLRSKYVHEGSEVNDENRNDVQRVCAEALRCFLRFQIYPESRRSGAVGSWLKRIDLIAAKIEAGEYPSDSELEANGVKLSN
jgi:hypothetical protein